MKTNLVERYIYAVTRHLPEKEREEISRELDELIASMLAERSDAPGTEEEKVRSVLTELGNPEELARKYSASEVNCLIGQPHYSVYLRVLEIVLIAVAGALTLALLISWIVSAPESTQTDLNPILDWVTTGAVEWIESIFSALLGAFAWVTIIFAILYRKGVKMDVDEVELDYLPEVPSESNRIGKGEAVGSIIFAVLFSVIFIVLPQINIPIIGLADRAIPFFNPDVLVDVRYLLIALIAATLLDAIIRYVEAFHTLEVFFSTLVSNVLGIVTAIVWFGNPQAVNPEFVTRLQELAGWNINGFNGEPLPALFGRWAMLPLPLAVALIVIVVVSIIEIITTAYKTFHIVRR